MNILRIMKEKKMINFEVIYAFLLLLLFTIYILSKPYLILLLFLFLVLVYRRIKQK